MSVIIHGLNMPRRSAVQVMIYPDGQAVVTTVSRKMFVCDALSLPEGHGDLIDRDALKKRNPMVIDYSAGGIGTDGSIRPVRGYGDWQIDQAPTIVPAEGGTDNG